MLTPGRPAEQFRSDPRIEFLRNLAETTGGRAVVNTNTPESQVPAVMAEGQSYYLLGFEPADGPRGPRKIEVRVNRRGVNVRARSGFMLPDSAQAVGASGSASIVGQGDASALRTLTNPLLSTADFPLRLQAAAFATPDLHSTVAIALSVIPPRPVDGTTTRMEIIVRALDHLGRPAATLRQTVDPSRAVLVKGTDYELIQQVTLAPGRYALRVGVLTGSRAASVYADVDVPDFLREGVAASDLMLATAPSGVLDVTDEIRSLVPLLPTTRRTFTARDSVTAFLRLYQRPVDKRAEHSAVSELVDGTGKVVFRQRTPLSRLADRDNTLDHVLMLPVSQLPPGPYALHVTIDSQGPTLKRAVRFAVIE
jgi:hypothetical protein